MHFHAKNIFCVEGRYVRDGEVDYRYIFAYCSGIKLSKEADVAMF